MPEKKLRGVREIFHGWNFYFHIWENMCIFAVGIVAFIFSVLGIVLGRKIGDYFGDKVEILGGVILILLGIKILLEGLGILVL